MKSTQLYIKQHTFSGMKYFGKTTKDPHTYKGSGKYWKRHIKKYGIDKVITCWVSKIYTNEEEIKKDALYISEALDIVNSDEWANLIPENGLGGNSGKHNLGRKWSKEINMKKGRKGCSQPERPLNDRKKYGIKNIGKTYSVEINMKKGLSNKGKSKEVVTCPYCNKSGGKPAMTRYHFNNCKLNQNKINSIILTI